MRTRLPRIIGTTALLIAALVLVTTCWYGLRDGDLRRRAQLTSGRCTFGLLAGGFGIGGEFSKAHPAPAAARPQPTTRSTGWAYNLYGITAVHTDDAVTSRYAMTIPWYLPPALIVLTIAARRGRRAFRRSRGRCPSCNYDLRATPDRCPECGTVPPPLG
jgi:hypothetical protein